MRLEQDPFYSLIPFLFLLLQIELQNMNSGEKFYIPVQRWLAQEQEDGEICREFPILSKGQPVLPGKEDSSRGTTDKTSMPRCGRTSN